MQLIRTLVWVIVAVAVALFAAANWSVINVRLWGDLVMQTPLAFLVIIAFLLGLLPPLIIYRARCWRLSRRLALAERARDEARAAPERGQEVADTTTAGAPLLQAGPEVTA